MKSISSARACIVPSACVAGLLALFCVSPSAARVLYVTNGGTGDGSSWASAMGSVQAALDTAVDGDEVWVAKGIYFQNVHVPAGVALYGGFIGDETLRSQRRWAANRTIFDGSGDTGTNASTVSAAGASVVDGFTICNSFTGVTVTGAATVANNFITRCIDGVDVNASPDPPYATVTNNTISSNYSNGVYTHTPANLINNTVTANAGYGLLIANDPTRLVVVNNLFAYNGGYGIGLFNTTGSPVQSHNDVYGNLAGEYKKVTAGSTNITVDPKLSNIYHDAQLAPDSPCIDAGDDSVVTPGETDQYGKPRLIGNHVDIGADESDGTVSPVPSRTWYVSPSGDDANDGTSWGQAKRTPAGAGALAQGGDQVWVAQGTYSTLKLVLHAGVAFYGGFAGNETQQSERNWRAHPVILDGGGSTSDAVVSADYFNTVLDGFTVRNGYIGVDARGLVTVSHCIISGNSGIGVYAYSNGATVTNCLVRANGDDGVYIQGPKATLINNTICDNGNFGVYFDNYRSRGTITNCIVAYNKWYVGIEFYPEPDPQVVFSRNDMYGCTGSSYPPSNHGGADIYADPLFVDRNGTDFHFQPLSPCIDAGDDSIFVPGDLDLDCNPRKLGAHVDIGAYEFVPAGIFTVPDAVRALRLAAGLLPPATEDARLDVTGQGIDITDAVRLARKAAGLDQNP